MHDRQTGPIHLHYFLNICDIFTDDDEALIRLPVGRRRAIHQSVSRRRLKEGNTTDIRQRQAVTLHFTGKRSSVSALVSRKLWKLISASERKNIPMLRHNYEIKNVKIMR